MRIEQSSIVQNIDDKIMRSPGPPVSPHWVQGLLLRSALEIAARSRARARARSRARTRERSRARARARSRATAEGQEKARKLKGKARQGHNTMIT
jgi:hypothetical protein